MVTHESGVYYERVSAFPSGDVKTDTVLTADQSNTSSRVQLADTSDFIYCFFTGSDKGVTKRSVGNPQTAELPQSSTPPWMTTS